MKTAFVFDTIPDISHGGGAITAYSILSILCNKSDYVYFVVLDNPNITKIENFKSTFDKNHTNYEFIFCNINFNSKKNLFLDLLFPSKSKLFKSWKESKKINLILSNLNLDFVFAYHWEALASIIEFKNCHKIVLVGDPMHLPFLFRGLYISENKSKFSLTYLVHKYIELTSVRLMKRYMKILLNQGQFCGAFAAHHTYDLNKITKRNNCKYVHTPTPDPLSEVKNIKTKNNKFKIMHIGHLKGIATLYGVRDIAYSILPIIDKIIGSDNYELHIVGGYFDELDIDIKNILKSHKSVIIRGQVSPSDLEFLTSDLLIVPTSIELGIRVRIITAFSFGLTVVAHRANQKGIPELENEVNCILGDNPIELAEGIIKLYQDQDLIKKISIESRNTYEKYFSLNAVGNHFQTIINEIINK